MMQYNDGRLIDRLLRQLYRAKPFTKAVPFNKVLPAADGSIDLWLPQNAFFELVLVTIRATVAGIDLTLCDTTPENPILFVMPDTARYDPYDLSPGYRSLNANQSKLILTNPAGTAASVKGVIFGFEVTKEGHYR